MGNQQPSILISVEIRHLDEGSTTIPEMGVEFKRTRSRRLPNQNGR